MKNIIEKIKILKNKKVTKNTMWIMAERIVQMLISLVVGVISARYLGPSNYGILNYGASLVVLFTAISKLGLETVMIKDLVDDRKKNGVILGTAMVMRLISSGLSILCITIIVMVLKPNDNVILVTSVLQAIAMIFQIYEILDFWFQSNLNSKYVSIAKTVAYVVVAGYKILLLILKKPVEWFAFSTTLDYLLILIMTFCMYKKNGGQKLKFSFKISKSLISRSYHFIISGIMVSIYGQMDKLMIGSYIGEKEVGLYSAATTISTMWSFIPDAIINSMRPVIYEANKVSKELYLKRQRLLYAIIFWLGIFFAMGITIFSTLIINIIYGKDYIAAKPALLVSAWYPTFAYLGVARNTWTVVNNKIKYTKRYIFWGAFTNVIFNCLLIPKWGGFGAAIATLIAEITVAIISPLFYKETRISVKHIMEAIVLKDLRKEHKKEDCVNSKK